MIVNHLATTLEDAIEVERDFLDHLQENSQNTIHIDTTKLSTSALASRVLHRFKKRPNIMLCSTVISKQTWEKLI